MDDASTIYIVTGAAGHLGSYVVRELLSRGRRVRALVLPNEACPDFIDINKHLLRQYAGDVCDCASLAPLFESPEGSEGRDPCQFVVIHCAGIVTISKKEDKRVYEVNVGGTTNIIDACHRHNVKRLVYVSSVHAIAPLPKGQVIREVDYFNPDLVHGYYAKTKAIATQRVLDSVKSGLNALVIHPAGIIGPNSLPTGNMAQVIISYLRGKLPAGIRGGYDFVDVRDVAEGIVAAADKGRRGACYILSNRFVDLHELLDTLSEVSGQKKQKFYAPLWLAKAAAPFVELHYRVMRKTPIYTSYSLRTITENAIYSHDKANRELGYRTRPLRETLADTAHWVKKTVGRCGLRPARRRRRKQATA